MEPGAYFTWQDGRFETARYYTPEYDIDNEKSLAEWETLIDETFRGSTAAHGIADVEVGCFLSSGVDSSYVVHEMAKRNRVRTFSVGYAEEKYSELASAEEFAKTEGVLNFTKKITAQEYFDATPAVQYYMDEPLPNPSAIALYFLAKLASEQVKVVLSGEGADELFGGYHYYREPLDFEKYMRLPLSLRRALAGLASKMPNFHGKRFLMRGQFPIEKRYIRNNYVYRHAEVNKVLAQPVDAPDPSAFTKPYFDEVKNEDDITKMHQETTKVALRGAAAKQLPEKTAHMRKTGFLTPLNDWLRRDEFYARVKETFESETAKRFFNTDFILKLLDDHKAGTAHNMKKIWSIYCFLLWYEAYFIQN